MTTSNSNDLIIVGGGPAGLSASIYALRAGLCPLVIEGESFGGQISATDAVDNYPGLEGLSGIELAERFRAHAEHLGVRFEFDSIECISNEGGLFVLRGAEKYRARSIVYAAGAAPRRAGFVGEDTFVGRGVSYCATCDGMFYRGKRAFVIGGGNTACEEALYLSKLSSKVTMIVRGERLRARGPLADAVRNSPIIEVRYLTSIIELKGENSNGLGLPTELVLSTCSKDGDNGKETIRFKPGSVGVFVAAGRMPRTKLVENLVDLDENGYVLTDDSMSTRIPGLFCAGDLRAKSLRQVVTAVSDGAIAATSAASYLDQY